MPERGSNPRSLTFHVRSFNHFSRRMIREPRMSAATTYVRLLWCYVSREFVEFVTDIVKPIECSASQMIPPSNSEARK